VQDVICNGRFLMRDNVLQTVDEAAAKAEAAQVAAEIDAFVLERESSPYNKLVFLSGVQRQESFEVQVKVPLEVDTAVLEFLHSDACQIIKEAHYKQYDNYFIFEGDDPDAARLRYREDEFVGKDGQVYQTRSRLTLIGEGERVEFPNAVMLSRSRFLADANRSLRFYREYFNPPTDMIVNKNRLRWHITYQDTNFALNLDQVTRPKLDGYFLEIKSRTWSRTDAERKANLIAEILSLLGVDLGSAERREYADIVLERGGG
jgi:5-methylthioadenosine/S-adenosylhomocysteine deaminase